MRQARNTIFHIRQMADEPLAILIQILIMVKDLATAFW